MFLQGTISIKNLVHHQHKEDISWTVKAALPEHHFDERVQDPALPGCIVLIHALGPAAITPQDQLLCFGDERSYVRIPPGKHTQRLSLFMADTLTKLLHTCKKHKATGEHFC